MSRWSIDPPDDDAYDVQYDGTDCADCGGPSVAWLCETCSDRRDSWAAATELRMASLAKEVPAVVEVALVPVDTNNNAIVIDVALVPVAQRDARFLKRMAKAILAADLANIPEVA